MNAGDGSRHRRARAELLLFLITFVWGSTFVLTKGLLAEFSPFFYVGVRFSFAAFLFVSVFPSAVRGWSEKDFAHGAILGMLLFAGFALQTIGLESTPASKSAFITGMLVVCTPLWQVALERRMPKPGSIAGVFMVVIGLFLLTSPDSGGFTGGDALTLGAALLFGLYIVLLDLYGSEPSASRLTLAQFGVCGFSGLLISLFFEDIRWSPAPDSLAILAYLIVFATIIALYVQTRYQQDSTPTRAAVIFSLEPVLAAGFAYVIAGEVMGVAGMAGGGLIVLGVLVSELSDRLVIKGKSATPGGGRE